MWLRRARLIGSLGVGGGKLRGSFVVLSFQDPRSPQERGAAYQLHARCKRVSTDFAKLQVQGSFHIGVRRWGALLLMLPPLLHTLLQ